MGIRVDLQFNQNQELVKYPCLMMVDHEWDCPTVVLFHKERCGTLLQDPTGVFDDVGFYREDWDMERFVLCTGTVILKNT